MRPVVLVLLLAACATTISPRDAVNAYFGAFSSGNVDAVPLAPEVTRGAVHGPDNLRAQLRMMAETTRGAIVNNLTVSRRHACAEVTLEPKSGTSSQYVECFDFDDLGRIAAIRVYLRSAAAKPPL